MNQCRIDIAILGGGLAGGLMALALTRLRPGRSVILVEAGERFGGNHIWSFFRRDVSSRDEWLTTPLVVRRWQGYDVRFPSHSRHLSSMYSSVTGERLDAILRETLPPDRLLTGAAVTEAGPTHFALADGRSFEVGGVIDARGAAGLPHLAGGWQKFAGQMLRLKAPHALERPVVMDARVEQRDGYRFVYCLPFSDHEVFVEDTYYSDGPELDVGALHDRIGEYAAAQGWRVAEVTRSETGVLPVIAGGDFDAFWGEGGGEVARAGTRAALAHPLTGYSLPEAVRFAMHVGGLDDISGPALAKASHAYARAHWSRGGFYRMLARMLFGAAAPDKRRDVMERFYMMPEPLIERFYAGRSTRQDMLRLLCGRPPVPLLPALASAAGRGRPMSPLALAA